MKALLKALLWIGLVAGVAYLIGWAFLFKSHEAPDHFMAPNLVRGDRYLVFVRTDFFRGAAALCEHPREPGNLVAGRIVGMPGDRVGIERGSVVLNGRPLHSTAEGAFILVDDQAAGSPLTHQLSMLREVAGMNEYRVLWPERGSVRPMRPVTVPDGEYFLLADNRLQGVDSRAYGTVRAAGCVGRPFLIYRPGPSSGDADRARRWLSLVD